MTPLDAKTPKIETSYLIRGWVESLPDDAKAQVKESESEIRAILAKYGKYAEAAIALIGSELAAK